MPVLHPSDRFSGVSSPASARRGGSSRSCSVAASEEVPEIVEESTDADNTVHVAVGTSVQKVADLLRWTNHHFRNVDVCFVHVHQPSTVIPTPLGNLPARKANPVVFNAYRKKEKEQMEELLSNYLKMCSKYKVKASYVMVEADQVHIGIADLVNKHRITRLVMGIASEKFRMVNKKTDYTAKHVPLFCEIFFVNKGKHLWTREASVELRSLSLVAHKIEPDFPLECLRSSSCLEVRNNVQDKAFQAEDDLCLTPSASRCAIRYQTSFGTGGSEYASSSKRGLSSELMPKGEDERAGFHLENARIEAEASKDEVVDEKLKCIKLELESLEAVDKVRDFDSTHVHVVKLRKDAEEALRTMMREKEKMLEEKEDITRRLWKTKKDAALLELHVEGAKLRFEEASAQLKLIKESIVTLQCEKHQIQWEKMEAAQWLERRTSGGQAGPRKYDRNLCFVDDSTKLAEFSLLDLETATCNFSESFKLGQGGYGCVYKGEMLNKTVSVRKLHPYSMQGQSEFQQEVNVLSKLQHPHLVTLIGVCPEAWSLVYEYLPNGSLQDYLSQTKYNASCLSWKTRTRIIGEISSALLFLHSSKPKLVVHGNLNPGNIFLDSELSSKICDFGICRMVSEETSRWPSFRQYTEPKGAFPYIDPEFNHTGVFTPKSDIYSFGLIILQLLTGMPPLGLASMVRKVMLCRKFESILDSSAGKWPISVATRLVNLGLQCCELNSRDRPELRPALVTELMQLHASEKRPVPPYFLCPILKEIMHDPQIAADGFTYEREALHKWLENGRKTSPMTNLELSHLHLAPNHALRLAIQQWLCKS